MSKLLGKLAEAGLLKAPPSKPAPPPEARAGPPPGLPGILWKITQARPLQCKTCGARFGEEEREELRVHMDWHFRRNMRGKASGAPPPSRRWLLPLDDWIAHEFSEAEGAEADQPQPSAFDAFGEAVPVETKEVAPAPVCPAAPVRAEAWKAASFAHAASDVGRSLIDPACAHACGATDFACAARYLPHVLLSMWRTY